MFVVVNGFGKVSENIVRLADGEKTAEREVRMDSHTVPLTPDWLARSASPFLAKFLCSAGGAMSRESSESLLMGCDPDIWIPFQDYVLPCLLLSSDTNDAWA